MQIPGRFPVAQLMVRGQLLDAAAAGEQKEEDEGVRIGAPSPVSLPPLLFSKSNSRDILVGVAAAGAAAAAAVQEDDEER